MYANRGPADSTPSVRASMPLEAAGRAVARADVQAEARDLGAHGAAELAPALAPLRPGHAAVSPARRAEARGL
jgi:hypothetical protein